MAVTGAYQFDLDGFTFGLGTSTSVVSLSGLDMPEIDMNTAVAGNRHGASTSGRYLKERTIGLNGRINGAYSTFPGLRDAVVRAFRPRRDDADVKFTFRLPGRAYNQYIWVKPHNIRGEWNNTSTAVGWWDFNATLVAADPRIYTETVSSVTLQPNAAATAAVNLGNFEAPTTITFNGQLTNPRIEAAWQGTSTTLRFGLTAEINSGQAYVVDSLNNTVYLGSTSKYSTRSATYRDWIELQPGTTNLTLVATGTGNAVVTWRSTSI